jgi:hypothetical protein
MDHRPQPDCTHRCVHGGEFRAFVVPPEECAALLIAQLKTANYLGADPSSRIVHVPFATAAASDRGGEPRQARVCETLQEEVRSARARDATLVVWRCFGAATAGSLEDAHWAAYRELGAAGLQAAYGTVARGAVEAYNARQLEAAAPAMGLCDGAPAISSGGSGSGSSSGIHEEKPPALESSDEEASWPGLRPLVPGMLPVACAYYDSDFLSQPDADRLLDRLVGENSEVVWAIGGQAAKRYTAVYCDDGLGEYAGGLGYANDTMRPWTPALRELRDRVVAWHRQKTGRDVAFNVVRPSAASADCC